MNPIKIYHNPKCSNSRNALALLREQGHEPEVVLYLDTPPTRQELQAIVQATGGSARALMRSQEAIYGELGLDSADLTEDALIDAMLTRLAPGGGIALSDASRAALMAHDWPGNVRELRNVIERALALGTDPGLLVAPLGGEPVAKGAQIREGLEFVRETLSSKYVKPDEREAVKSAIKQHNTYEIIDKISVRLVETHDKYWARLSNLDLDFINVEESQVREHDRLLMGGVWAEIKLRYDDFKIATRDHTAHSYTADGATIRQLAGQCLKRVPLDKRLRLLGVRASTLVRRGEEPEPDPQTRAAAASSRRRPQAGVDRDTGQLF